MTSEPGEQTVTVHISLNISQSKGNQPMKFSHVIEYSKKYFSSKIMQKVRQED